MTRQEINEKKQLEIIKEQNKEKLKKFIKLFLKIIFFLIISITIFFYYTTNISTVKIKVREYRIINKKIPSNFNGLKIIQLSDLHYGSTMFLEEVKNIVSISNARNPDLIVFTGDLIDKNYKLTTKEQEKIINEFTKLNSSLGKYAILGEEDNNYFTTIMNQSNFTILKNESELLYNEENYPILLTGVSTPIKNKEDLDIAYSYFNDPNHISNIFNITILHQPDYVDKIITNYQIDLFLAGHSHNGNIRIPFLNYAIKKEGAKKYDQDYYSLPNSKLYISSGLGTNNSNSIRLFCRPSINFYRLSNK